MYLYSEQQQQTSLLKPDTFMLNTYLHHTSSQAVASVTIW